MESSSLNDAKLPDDIDLKQLFDVLWASKLKIILITFVFSAASVFFSLSVPNQYKATVLLAPAQSGSGDLSSAIGQFGGLASFAGVTIGSGDISESKIAQEIMKSWSFIETFIVENNLAVMVYAAKGWDKASNKLVINEKAYDLENNKWLLKDYDTGSLRPPTSWRLFKKFSKMLSVSEVKKSGLISVSIEYFSPQIAKDWLDMYIETINKHMQARQVAKVSNNISYLEAQIDKTSIAEMREVFYTIIEEQTKNKMVAEASPDYAFVAVSSSMLPEEKSRPKRALICILGAIFGGLFSVLWVLVRYYFTGSNEILERT